MPIKKTETKPFRAFGEIFSRDEAEWLIYKSKWVDIVACNVDGVLEHIIFDGWKGLSAWSDYDVQYAMDDLDESILKTKLL